MESAGEPLTVCAGLDGGDDLKLRSCATLFADVSPPRSVLYRLLEKYDRGDPDGKTRGLLGVDAPVLKATAENHESDR